MNKAKKYSTDGITAATTISRYGTSRLIAIIKAVAPIIGGIRTPPVDAQASTPPATCGLNPILFIAGIERAPVVRTFVITLPLIEPINPDAKIATLAGPPRTYPKREKAKLRKNCPPPVYCSATPNNRNPITKPAKALVGIPINASVESA